MSGTPFDEHAEKYDAWFLKNRNVLRSEVLLLKYFLKNPGKALSVGCGSGLFEHLFRVEHGIDIRYGVEPSEQMGSIAEKRGMTVKQGKAEALPFDDEQFDTVIMNGIPSYITELNQAFQEAHRVLKSGGKIVVADVPAESSYGLLYRLGGKEGTWETPYLKKIIPEHPYPAEFTIEAQWRTTQEKENMLRNIGFVELRFAQTLTRHPKYSNDSVEEPIEGYDRGDYVAICALKK